MLNTLEIVASTIFSSKVGILFRKEHDSITIIIVLTPWKKGCFSR